MCGKGSEVRIKSSRVIGVDKLAHFRQWRTLCKKNGQKKLAGEGLREFFLGGARSRSSEAAELNSPEQWAWADLHQNQEGGFKNNLATDTNRERSRNKKLMQRVTFRLILPFP